MVGIRRLFFFMMKVVDILFINFGFLICLCICFKLKYEFLGSRRVFGIILYKKVVILVDILGFME